MKKASLFTLILAGLLTVPAVSLGQGTVADYLRADGLRAKYEALAINVAGPVTWFENSTRFWYRKTVTGGAEFVMVDAATRQKQPAFDHEKLAAALSRETRNKYTGLTLPFTTFTFADNQQAIQASVDGVQWPRGDPEKPARTASTNVSTFSC